MTNKYFYFSKYSELRTPLMNFTNKTEKIDEDVDVKYFNIQWINLCFYTKYLTIDESIASYKGRIYIKQFMKDKPKNLISNFLLFKEMIKDIFMN